MNERGFSVLELLVAAAMIAVVLLGAGAFYLAAVRFGEEDSAQIFLQRQATMVKDEMAKQIQAGSLASLQLGCPAFSGVSDPNALQITNSNDPGGTGCGATGTCNYCFHRDATFTRLLKEGPGGQWDLLSGGAAKLTVTTGGCPGSGGFCPALVYDNSTPPQVAAAAITLRMRYQNPVTNSYQTMTFATTLTPRNP